MTHRAIVPLFAIAFMLAGAGAGLAQDAGLFLRHRQAQGDKATYVYSCSTRAQTRVGNSRKTERAQVSLQMKLTTEVLETTPGGDMRIRADITSGNIKASAGRHQQTVPVKSAVLEYLVSGQGVTKRVNLTSGKPPTIGLLPYTATPDDVFLASGVGRFPDKRLKPGDTWEGVARIPSTEGGGAMEVPFKSKLVSVGEVRGRPCATIKTTARAVSTDDKPAEDGSRLLSVHMDVAQELTWAFDYERGVVVSAQGTTRISLALRDTGSGSGASGSARISGVMNTRATLLEFNGQKVPKEEAAPTG